MKIKLQTFKLKKQFHFLIIRSKIKEFIKPLFKDEIILEKIMICLSELSTNILKHAGEGFIQFGIEEIKDSNFFIIIAKDNGKGIKNIEEATKKGFSTKNTLGIGFSVLKTNSDFFEIKNLDTGGLFVKIGWKLSNFSSFVDSFLKTVPAKGHKSGGDFIIKIFKEGRFFIGGVFDVLGHGNSVSGFAREYKLFIEKEIDNEITSPKALLFRLNKYVNGKRGCVGTIFKMDFQQSKLTISGVGNIKTVIIIDDKTFEPSLTNGIIENAIKIKENRFEVKNFCTIAMASDGIHEKWVSHFKKFFQLNPGVLVTQIFKKFQKDYDDSTMLVAKWKLI